MYNVTNNAKTELDAIINDGSTTITVPSGYGAVFPDGDFVVTVWGAEYASPGDDVGREIIYISTRSGDTLTIGARAQEGTSQVDHAVADHIALLFTAGTWDQIVDYVDTNVTTEAATGAEIDAGTEANKHVTPAAIADSYLLLTEILGAVYPIGSIYTSIVSTNPNTLFGFGTWSAFGAGKVLVGLDSGDTDFDTAEETGGAKTVTLTSAQSGLPSHNHTQNAHTHTQDAHLHDIWAPSKNLAASGSAIGNEFVGSGKDAGGETRSTTATNQNTTATNNANTAANASEAHSNLQPYIVVYMWKRTA
jgi:microcystin-dependent protein